MEGDHAWGIYLIECLCLGVGVVWGWVARGWRKH